MDVSITITTQNPAGTMLDFSSGTVPFGYLACDGSVVSRTTYARLFEVISTYYGAGDGSTTFKLPDSRGRVSVGSGTGSGLTNRVLGATGGEENHLLTSSEMPSHTHTVTDSGHNHTQNSHNHTQNSHNHRVLGASGSGTSTSVKLHSTSPNYSAGIAGDSTLSGSSYITNDPYNGNPYIESTTPTNNAATATNNSATTGVTNQNTGGGTSHNNMQPFLVCTKIIKY